jgi:predicted secreted hydrolase
MGKQIRAKLRKVLGVGLLTLFLLMPNSSAEQKEEKTFKQALPGWRYAFPRDHRVHREFKTEWWYYTGHLQDSKGNGYGYLVTFFRVGLVPGNPSPNTSQWRIRDVYLAHLAVSDIKNKRFLYSERASRGNLGLAGAEEKRYRVWVENWQVSEEGQGHRLMAGDRDLGLSLSLIPARAPIIHGINGVSQKGEEMGQASHYYSLTRLLTKGKLRIKGKEITVSGLSWMDHEFGSNQLSEQQIGWDWFSLQLDNGLDLMIYQLRRSDGSIDANSSGSLVLSDSQRLHLSQSEISIQVLNYWKSPRSGATYPSSWSINLPQQELKLELSPLMADQELITSKSTRVTYWEGAVRVKGNYKGRNVEGQGYVELTGYDKRFRPKI